jgi:Spy/CpxP family protein refolding chaperone
MIATTSRTLLRLASLAVLSTSLAFAQGPSQHDGMGGGPGGGGMGFRGGHDGMSGGFHMGGPGMWWKNPDLVAKLGLTADQQKRMEDIFLQSRIQLIHMKASLEEQELLLEPIMNANPPDNAKALAQIGKIADTRADLEKANAKMLLGIRGVLTATQWTTLHELEHRRHDGMGRDGMGRDGKDGRDGMGKGSPNAMRPHRGGPDGAQPAPGGAPTTPPPPGDIE